MTELVIKIDWIWLLGIFGSIILIAWKGGSRFTAIESTITFIKDDIQKMWSSIEGKNKGVLQTKSPITYTDKGLEILVKSGLKDYIDENKVTLTNDCKDLFTAKNAYDIQEAAFKYMDEISIPLSLEEKVKTAAFESGISIELVRRVAGIYFRDILLTSRNMTINDIDKSNQ